MGLTSVSAPLRCSQSTPQPRPRDNNLGRWTHGSQDSRPQRWQDPESCADPQPDRQERPVLAVGPPVLQQEGSEMRRLTEVPDQQNS